MGAAGGPARPSPRRAARVLFTGQFILCAILAFVSICDSRSQDQRQDVIPNTFSESVFGKTRTVRRDRRSSLGGEADFYRRGALARRSTISARA